MSRPPKWEAEIKAFREIMLDRMTFSVNRQKFHSKTAYLAAEERMLAEAAHHNKAALLAEGEAITIRILLDEFDQLFNKPAQPAEGEKDDGLRND